MPDQRLTESKRRILTLTAQQVSALRLVGKQLASSKTFWADSEDEEPETTDNERTVVSCRHLDDDRYEVTVRNAVGIIALPELQLVVQPKIPTAHMQYLMEHSPVFPRVDDQVAQSAEASTLWELVAAWYLAALEALLRQGLLSDYSQRSDLLPELRGTLQPRDTAMAYYRGIPRLACDYDEFGPDTALNRVLRAAALAVAHAPFLDLELRRRARRALARLDDVGDLQRTDLRTALDRRTAPYETPLTLAKHVLAATGRAFESGTSRASTFLIPTPDLVESAIRRILRDGLATRISVRKKGRQLPGSTLTINPDLVFGNVAVGDVKYKLLGDQWQRPDLYQAVTFATGYTVKDAAIVTFSDNPGRIPGPVQVGQVVVQAHAWDCSDDTTPEQAAATLLADVGDWIDELLTPSRSSTSAFVPDGLGNHHAN